MRWAARVLILLVVMAVTGSVPVLADSVLHVQLSDISFYSSPELVSASFDWNVTESTVDNIFLYTSPIVFEAASGAVTANEGAFQDVTYLEVVDIGLDSYGDVLQIYNDYSPQQGIPAVPGTYDASLRIGQVFYSCGPECQAIYGFEGGFHLANAGTITVTAVPEPSPLALLISGLFLIAAGKFAKRSLRLPSAV